MPEFQISRLAGIKYIGIAAACGGLLALSAESHAASFTDSSQLQLSGKLAAVNFYYSGSFQDVNGQKKVTSPIQGAVIDNYDLSTTTNTTAFSLTGGGTLTATLPHRSEDRGQTVAATVTGAGADEAPAEDFATTISYFAAGDNGSLNFAFGAGQANKAVQVQLLGGDEGWGGTLTASVSGVTKGSFNGDFDASTAELITFTSTTDASGNLLVDLSQTAGNYVGLAGVVVSAVPEPGSLGFLTLGSVVLLSRKRR